MKRITTFLMAWVFAIITAFGVLSPAMAQDAGPSAEALAAAEAAYMTPDQMIKQKALDAAAAAAQEALDGGRRRGGCGG